MQFSRFFRYENWVVQKMIVRLLLTMLGHVLREEPWGSWSGRGAGASMMFMSWHPNKIPVNSALAPSEHPPAYIPQPTSPKCEASSSACATREK